MTAHTADYSEGYNAYQRGDYDTALRIIRQFADRGQANAQNTIGIMYENGQGVTQSYLKAADQGDTDAQSNLGVMYGKGRGVPQDYGEAVMWFRKAADQGHTIAQYYLGVIF